MSMRIQGMVVAGAWTGFGIYTAVTGLQIGPATAALLCFLLARDAFADARRR